MSNTFGRRVAVTGVGMVSPLGGDTDDFFARILCGESAIRLHEHPTSPYRLAQPAVTCPQFDPDKAIGHAITHVSVAMALGLDSACLTYSVVCASSTVSIGEVFRRNQRGSESPLAFPIVRAWDAMRVVAAGDE